MSANPSDDGKVSELEASLEQCRIVDTSASGAPKCEASAAAVPVASGTVEGAGAAAAIAGSSVALPTTSKKGNTGKDTTGSRYVSYTAGDIIQDKLKPFTKTLKIAYRGKRCNNCFSVKNKLRHCKACGLMNYCNKECQKEDWHNGHKIECKSPAFKTYSGNGKKADLVFQIFRLWATLKNPENGKKAYKLYDGSTRTYEDLPSNAGKHVVKPEWIEEVRKVVAELSKEDPSVTLDLFINYYEILQTNGFTIKNDDESEDIGLGIYIQASVFQHSCKPTAFYWINGTEMQIRAIAPIPEGEPPTVSFITRSCGREERRKQILDLYNFECHCTLCETQVDAGMDYELLASLQMYCENARGTNLSWPEVVHAHMTVIGMLERIYHKFDDRITHQFKVVSEFGIWKLGNCGDMANFPWFMAEMETQLSLITVEAEHRLYKTYGSNHYEFKEFKRKLPQEMRDVYYR